jgi:AbrB family looped-hinge helix DNA binding protein
MRITSKGQVTIPIGIREAAGLMPGTEVEFVLEEGAVRLRPRVGVADGRGRRLVRHLRGRGSLGLSTDEILALTRGEA